MRGEIEHVTLLGGGAMRHRHDEHGLRLDLPRGSAGEFVPVVRIDGRGLL
jgi:alpha-L-fucosidase